MLSCSGGPGVVCSHPVEREKLMLPPPLEMKMTLLADPAVPSVPAQQCSPRGLRLLSWRQSLWKVVTMVLVAWDLKVWTPVWPVGRFRRAWGQSPWGIPSVPCSIVQVTGI